MIYQARSDRSTTKPKGKTEKEKRDKCLHGKLNENEDDLQPLHPLEKSHHVPSTPKHRIPSNTFNKRSGDGDVAARTSPRIFPGTHRVVERGYTRRPLERNDGTRRIHRVDARWADRDFSRPPKPTPRTICNAPLNLPPTTILQTSSPSHRVRREA
jgi:hypothetical protein